MSRPVTYMEVDVAKMVFKRTLPYEVINISDGTGFGDRPYTTRGFRSYTLHLGSYCFNTPIYEWSFEQQATFVHELTHVWQGHHSSISWGFMISSIFSQAGALLGHGDTAYAYNYTIGASWGHYNVEQQANIVEDWFYYGRMSPQDGRYEYIRDHIWPGKN